MISINPYIVALIGSLTPLIIAGIKKLIGEIPPKYKWLLPIIAPLIGIVLDQAQSYLTGHVSPVIAGAIAGGLGTWLRELVTQLSGIPSQIRVKYWRRSGI